MSWTVPGMGALLPVWTIWRAAGLASAALAALPEKVAVLVKLRKEAGVNCELNWQAPPMVTLMDEEMTQSVLGVGVRAKFVWSGSLSVRLAAALPVESRLTVMGGALVDAKAVWAWVRSRARIWLVG